MITLLQNVSSMERIPNGKRVFLSPGLILLAVFAYGQPDIPQSLDKSIFRTLSPTTPGPQENATQHHALNNNDNALIEHEFLC